MKKKKEGKIRKKEIQVTDQGFIEEGFLFVFNNTLAFLLCLKIL